MPTACRYHPRVCSNDCHYWRRWPADRIHHAWFWQDINRPGIVECYPPGVTNISPYQSSIWAAIGTLSCFPCSCKPTQHAGSPGQTYVQEFLWSVVGGLCSIAEDTFVHPHDDLRPSKASVAGDPAPFFVIHGH